MNLVSTIGRAVKARSFGVFSFNHNAYHAGRKQYPAPCDPGQRRGASRRSFMRGWATRKANAVGATKFPALGERLAAPGSRLWIDEQWRLAFRSDLVYYKSCNSELSHAPKSKTASHPGPSQSSPPCRLLARANSGR